VTIGEGNAFLKVYSSIAEERVSAEYVQGNMWLARMYKSFTSFAHGSKLASQGRDLLAWNRIHVVIQILLLAIAAVNVFAVSNDNQTKIHRKPTCVHILLLWAALSDAVLLFNDFVGYAWLVVGIAGITAALLCALPEVYQKWMLTSIACIMLSILFVAICVGGPHAMQRNASMNGPVPSFMQVELASFGDNVAVLFLLLAQFVLILAAVHWFGVLAEPPAPLPPPAIPDPMPIESRLIEALSADDVAVPDEFKCPITLEVMSDPVVAGDGHTYELQAVQRHFTMNGLVSPKTREVMTGSLVRNHNLRRLIAGLGQEQLDLQEQNADSTPDR